MPHLTYIGPPEFLPRRLLAGNLYNDDKILSVAHQFQIHSDWHTKRPTV